MQLPSGEWILAAKAQVGGGSQPNMPAPPLHRFAVVQVRDKTISAVIMFSGPAWSYAVTQWSDEPCKNVTSYIVKSTLNQTRAMPECFVVANLNAGAFEALSDTHKEVARWAHSNSYALPVPMLQVHHTKYHKGDYFRLNAHFAGGLDSAPAAEAWGREAASSLTAMITRATPLGQLPELPAFASTLGATQPVAAQPMAGSATAAAPGSAEARLRQLKSLLDSKLITPEEYEGKRKKIVDEM
ncbi:hypothetical protein PMI14_05500 [Acidovorax sp. CF316]|nr:hypothetical protein PMI14_05500 [Acidovorax sp. CF316]